ncbi:MAG TPA: tetratricopeptide repeat protein [Caulobacteraceae bacterium]|jgi:tetratricopeptide (TPR) repeat protein|nr:tetratricopeptide repeat protein [Caulobacteraceae bacterium]
MSKPHPDSHKPQPSRSRAVLRATTAAVCAGTIAASPLAGSLAQAASETKIKAQAPVEVRVGVNSDFSRIEFRGRLGARAGVTQSGSTVTVHLPKGAQPDLGRLRVDPPRGVSGVDTHASAGGLDIVLTLDKGATSKAGRADGAVFLNLFPPKDAAAPPPARLLRPDPVPAGGAVKVAAQVDGEQLTLRFPWAAPAGAAVFRRAGAVFIVFDARARLDLAGAPRSLGAVHRISWLDGADFTVVRIEAAPEVSVAAASDGANWTVVLGGPRPHPDDAVKIERDDQTGPPALTAALTGATKVIWLTDPAIGDRFAAVTAMGDVRGVTRAHSYVEGRILQTVQGLAIEAVSPDLKVAIDGDLVRVSRPGGLDLSPPGVLAHADDAPTDLPQAAPMPGLIDTVRWSRVGRDGFLGRYRQLEEMASVEAAKGQNAPVPARMALARFLVGTELNFEAIGVLDLIAKTNPSMLNDPEFRGLRGAARAMARRYKEADADFASPAVANDPASNLWRGYIDTQLGQYVDARKAFVAGSRAIDLFSPKWKARFAVAHAQAALELKDPDAARSLLSYALAQPIDAPEQLRAYLVEARLFEDRGDRGRALAVYKAVAEAPLDDIATPALLHATKLEYAMGAIKPQDAVATLDSLRFRWRGDATELDVIRSLGEIYLSQGRYREALEALRSAGQRLPDSPAAQALQAELADAFRKLFLQGQADGLQPIQALALFLDFRELTPVGADGDEMVRRLARRLIDVDLLPQAAELLKYQADNRLDGVAKAQVSTDLAAVYLMDEQPEKALDAIWGSRTTLLPNALNAQRRVLEARALTGLGKFDNALEILGKDNAPEAQDARAEVFWKQKDWAKAGDAYTKRLGDRWKTAATPLTGEEESRLIRAGVALSLAGDGKGLAALSQHYSGFIDHAQAPDALRVALAGLDGGSITPQDFAKAVTQADTFTGWVAAMKQHFRDAAAKALQTADAGGGATG